MGRCEIAIINGSNSAIDSQRIQARGGEQGNTVLYKGKLYDICYDNTLQSDTWQNVPAGVIYSYPECHHSMQLVKTFTIQSKPFVVNLLLVSQHPFTKNITLQLPLIQPTKGQL
jgi:hypothetical protein